ncbi:MAG: hypothetical protein GX649_10255 [Chloroflexi bacterium]|nr:hypothetical protein [Chloroflexota bacterium]
MNKRTRHAHDLVPLLVRYLLTSEPNGLYDYIRDNSNLPGRRANLELAAAFGDVAGRITESNPEAIWRLTQGMTEIDAAQAPTDAPLEFVPFCGTVALGAVAAACPDRLPDAMDRLRQVSRDARWRLHEAVAMGLQRLLTSRAEETLDGMAAWILPGDPLPARAVAAGLADPWILEDPAIAERALALHRRILNNLQGEDQRHTDGYRTLRQGLAHTLSVVVAADPEHGFPYLEELAKAHDRDVRWILGRNLSKDRLTLHYAGRVARVVALLHANAG